MACQVKTSGAITINPFRLEIDWGNKNGNFKEITTEKTVFFASSDVIDVFTTTPNFFVIGCSKCSSNPGNYGVLKVIEPETMNVISEVKGTVDNKNVGKSVSFNINTDFSE